MAKERYPMCDDQPAQIDCRVETCSFHKDGNCTNVSPAIVLLPSGYFICWSRTNFCVCDCPEEKLEDNGCICIHCGGKIACEFCEEDVQATVKHVDYFTCEKHYGDAVNNVANRTL